MRPRLFAPIDVVGCDRLRLKRRTKSRRPQAPTRPRAHLVVEFEAPTGVLVWRRRGSWFGAHGGLWLAPTEVLVWRPMGLYETEKDTRTRLSNGSSSSSGSIGNSDGI